MWLSPSSASLFLLNVLTASLIASGEQFKWKNKDYASQAIRLQCKPLHIYTGSTLAKHSKAGNITKLGKVADIEVCALLCCESASCDVAMYENKICNSVSCFSKDSCETANAPITSHVVLVSRKGGQGIWSEERDRGDGTGDKQQQENKAKIVTKEAAVQKSSIPQNQDDADSKDSSVVAITNKDRGESPMDKLLQAETAMVKTKVDSVQSALASAQQIEAKEAPVEAIVPVAKEHAVASATEKVQDVTEHYLKADEKSDVTAALQESDTRTLHKKVTHEPQKDLRHTLISPITIGAFTCMAVIAVSGFAMAIIKYQREQKTMEDKQTQQP